MTATISETSTDVVLAVRDLVVEIDVPRREPIRPVRGVSFEVAPGAGSGSSASRGAASR